jgi:uncharacterized protein (UPF0262 family)
MPDQAHPPEQIGLSRNRLIEINLDEKSLAARANSKHECDVAMYDLLEENSFALVDRDEGPYKLKLGRLDDRLVFDVADEHDGPLITHVLSFSPLRRIMRDYFMVCDTYYDAIKTAPPSKIQTIDMGRRGLHDEGSRLLSDRLQGKITIDHSTSRRLFTLICSLYWKA